MQLVIDHQLDRSLSSCYLQICYCVVCTGGELPHKAIFQASLLNSCAVARGQVLALGSLSRSLRYLKNESATSTMDQSAVGVPFQLRFGGAPVSTLAAEQWHSAMSRAP